MRKITPLKFQFNYIDNPDSESKVKSAYRRIFNIAKQNILERRKIKKKGGEKHVTGNYITQL
jgi:hypothetical protein